MADDQMVQPPVAETDDDSMDMSSSGQPQIAAQPQQAPVQPQMAAQPQVAAQQPQQPPVQVVAAHPKASLFHSLLNALGGGDKIQYSVDPQTGAMSASRVPQTSGSLGKAILSGALTGLFSGASESSGPGTSAFGKAGMASMQKQQQQQVQQQQQAKEDFERQEKEKLQQAQVFKSNLQMYGLANQLGRLNKDQHDQTVSGYKDQLSEYAEQQAVKQSNVSEKEAMDSSKYPPGQFLRVPDGSTPRTDENGKQVFMSPSGQITTEDSPANVALYDNTYSIIDRNARMPLRDSVPVSQDGNITTNQQGGELPWVKSARNWGPAVGGAILFDPVTKQPRQNVPNDMPAAAAVTMQHQVAGLDAMAHELDNYARTLSTPESKPPFTDADGKEISAKDYLKQQIAKNPKLMGSIEQWRRTASTGSTEPDIQILDHMNADDKSKAAKGDLMNLFGGGDMLQKYKEARENRVAGGKAAAAEQAREDIKSQTPEGRQELENKQLTAQEKRLQIDKLQKETSGADLSKISTTAEGLDGVNFNAADPNYRINQGVLQQLDQQDQGLAATVRAIGEGRELMTPQAQRTKDGQAILKAVNMAYPDYNAAKVESYHKGRQIGTSGSLGNKVNSFATAMDHLQRYYDNINMISATAGVGSIAAVLGNEKAKALQTDRTALASEIASAYKGGVPSKEEIEKWEKSLSGGTAAAAKNGAVETAKLLHGKFSEYANQYRNMIPGGLRDDNFQLMSGTASNAYQHVTGQPIGNTQPFTQGQQRPQTQQSVAPEGTVINVNGQQQIKQNGKWVPYAGK